VGLDRVVVEVGGVGLVLHTTPAAASECRRGTEVELATSLVVREDSLTLYGFRAGADRDMFETLQSVSGVGPRLALAMLSVMGPAELATALRTGDAKALTTIPGIGAKSAQRLVLELRDKVGVAPSGTAVGEGGVASVGGGTGWRGQVSEALVGLGWSVKQAGEAVEKVASSGPKDADIASYLRLALRELRR
jgi:Holliday junction DNA helicase RuvA